MCIESFQKQHPADRQKAEKAAPADMARAEAEEALELRMQNESSLLPEFDELATLSGEEMAKLLAREDMDMLAIALKGGSGAVIRCIHAAASGELWERILDNFAFIGPVRRIDAIAAQRAILAAWKAPGMDRTADFRDNESNISREEWQADGTL